MYVIRSQTVVLYVGWTVLIVSYDLSIWIYYRFHFPMGIFLCDINRLCWLSNYPRLWMNFAQGRISDIYIAEGILYIYIYIYIYIYPQTCSISRTWVGNAIVDHVCAAPTTSSFSTSHLVSMDWAKATARWEEKHLYIGIWCGVYQMFYVIQLAML